MGESPKHKVLEITKDYNVGPHRVPASFLLGPPVASAKWQRKGVI